MKKIKRINNLNPLTHQLMSQGGKRLTIGGLAAVAAASFVMTVHATDLYTITELSPLTTGGGYSQSYAINNNGQVAGWWQSSGSGTYQAVLWQDGSVAALGVNTGSAFKTYGINNPGQVVGGGGYSLETSSTSTAFLWQNGTVTTLGTLGGASGATAINDNGQIVGFSYDSAGYRHAVLWQNGNITNLDVGSGSFSEAYGINKFGQVVGWSSSPYSNNDSIEPTMWQGGTAVALGTLPKYDSGQARAINNTGQIVGWVSGTNNVPSQAFLWQNGTMTALPALSVGSATYAYGINDVGQVVGNSGYRAALWQDGTVINLNNVIPTNSDWVLNNARGINDKGQIVGGGTFDGRKEAFLMTPVPEHTTLALLTVAGAGLFLLKRRNCVAPTDNISPYD